MSDMSFNAVRARLRNPPNAVPDVPIDLKRTPERERHKALPPIALKIVPATPYMHIRRFPTLEDITRVICEHFNVTTIDLESDRRQRSIVRPRQMWAYLARTMTPISLPQIGRYLGGRDHTTVLHACNKMKSLREGDTIIADEIDLVQRKVQWLFNSRNNLTCFDPREI